MCCLFGVVNYSGKKNKNIDELINYLAQEATIRGEDSTGIAYNKDGKLKVYKKPKSAWDMDFNGLENCVSITGHTRHATQGSHTKNYNNHPFYGKCENLRFALAHNGVIWNDAFLRKQYELPQDRIETDSYIAVQLLEYFDELNVANVRRMAELVNGSFTFTLTDTEDTTWFIKGSNPLALVHFPQLKLYVYASTEQILFTALCRSKLVEEIAWNEFDSIYIKSGDIVRIDKNGEIKTDRFCYDEASSWGYSWQNYSVNSSTNNSWDNWDSVELFNAQYLADIKTVAKSMGITEEFIDELYYKDGYTLEDIEDFIYSYEFAMGEDEQWQ